MKKIIQLSVLMLFMMAATSCEDEDFTYPEGQVGISKITVYPTLTLNGDRYMVIVNKSVPFSDPGAIAKEGDTEIPVTTTGSVDENTPGVYTLTYTAANKDGFTASTSRTVVIANVDAAAAANDLSGNYARTTNGSVAVWTKIGSGVYTVFNPGGAPGTNLTVVAVNATGDQIDIPAQAASDGSPTSSSQESYNKAVSPPTYSWVIVNPGYGTALRTFVKQ
ncbi:DUF5011 domain-containing protein [Flavihumibacter sp. R14]|nr:DUF5011 domain-containing protein [Flavihumibacter soli]